MDREYWDAFWECCDETGPEWAEHVGRQGIDGWTSDSDVAEFALAVWQGRDDEAVQLIRGGLDLSADFFYRTPAEWAASLGCVAALKAMRARDGGTERFEAALRLAVGCDQMDSAEWLIDAGASYDGRFLSPLEVACSVGNLRMVELLASRGADINQRWVRGMTPLMEVADWGTRRPRIVAANFGTCGHTRTTGIPGFSGRTVRDLVRAPDYVGLAERLLQFGANANARDDNGHTAYDHAVGVPHGSARYPNPELTDLLVRSQGLSGRLRRWLGVTAN